MNPITINNNGTIFKFNAATNFTATGSLPGGATSVGMFRVFSPTFGFAVGATGDYALTAPDTDGFTPKIWKYDGTTFTAMTLPAGLKGRLHGVYVLSTTKAWAVGDRGESRSR